MSSSPIVGAIAACVFLISLMVIPRDHKETFLLLAAAIAILGYFFWDRIPLNDRRDEE